MEVALQQLNQGQWIHVFPEGINYNVHQSYFFKLNSWPVDELGIRCRMVVGAKQPNRYLPA